MTALIALSDAKAGGYKIDRSCYPWVAYKGPRFNPTEWRFCQTQTEADLAQQHAELLAALKEIATDCDALNAQECGEIARAAIAHCTNATKENAP